MEVDKIMWGLTNLNSLQAEDKEAITNFWNQRKIDLQAFGNYLDAERTENKDRPFKEIIAAASTAWNKDALDKKKLSAPKSVKRRAYQFSEMTNKLVAFKDEAGLTKEDKEYLRPLVVTTTKSLKTDDFEECDGRTADQIYLDFMKLNHFDNYEHWNLSAEKRTETLNKQFDEYIEMYKEESKISGFVPLGGASNEVVTIAGRIVNTDPDAEFKSSVELINLSAENEHGRTKVKLNLDDVVDPVLLFEGQIVVAKGTWDQENFYVQSIDTLPIVKAKYENTQMENGMLSVYVFAGPYSFPDSLNYTMLKQVVGIIKEHKPHFVILAGPFVDINNDYVKEGEFMFYNDKGEVDWFEDLDIYGSIKNYIDSAIKSTNTKVWLIPSVNDITSLHPFPQPPLTSNETDKVKFLPNPARFLLNGVEFGVVNTDIIRAMMARSMHLNLKSHRLVQSAWELARQRSFYPIYPPKEDVPVDISQYKLFEMVTAPDVLITVSELIPFTEVIDDKFVIVNPGVCIKGKAGGSFASISLKIDNDAKEISSRVRVDIKQISSSN